MRYKREDAAVRATPEWAAYLRVCEEVDSAIRKNVNGQGRVEPMTSKQHDALDTVWNAVKATKEWAAAPGEV